MVSLVVLAFHIVIRVLVKKKFFLVMNLIGFFAIPRKTAVKMPIKQVLVPGGF